MTTAPLLSFGPLFVIAIVHANGAPGVNDAGALLTSERSAVRRAVVACTVALLEGIVSGSAAVTSAALNAVPEVPALIDSARIV